MNCGECRVWFQEDFDQACPVFKTQLNNLNNKVIAIKKKSKVIGATLHSDGVGIFTEACSKFVGLDVS